MMKKRRKEHKTRNRVLMTAKEYRAEKWDGGGMGSDGGRGGEENGVEK